MPHIMRDEGIVEAEAFEEDAGEADPGCVLLLTAEKGAVSSVTVNNQPNEFLLSQNYPNPFNPITTIEFFMPNTGHAELAVYNIAAQKVKFFSGFYSVGNHSVARDGTDDAGIAVASGVYAYQLRVDHGDQTTVKKKRMLLLK